MKIRDAQVLVLVALVTSCCASLATAGPINIVDPSYPHFTSFVNDPPAGDPSRISAGTVTRYGDFGWHNSPSWVDGWPQYAGIMLGSKYIVTALSFQVHTNPFKSFSLQGSNDTTSGLDGTWDTLFSGEVQLRVEYDWVNWTFPNSDAYSSYRIQMSDDYAGGWAMYRWRLEGVPASAPEPSTLLLLGLGLAGLTRFGWRHGRG